MKPSSLGVLFVHGIQGKPAQFDFLEQLLPADVRRMNVDLPGHGATAKEFRRAGMTDWLASVKAQARELCLGCDRVLYVGHSMGCLLGLLATEEPDISFSGMLLLCCPFAIRPTLRYFRNNMLAIKTRGLTDDPFVKAAWEANSVAVKSAAEYVTCLRPYLGLLRLIHRGNRQKSPPDCPIHFFFSSRDEIVSPRSAKRAAALPCTEVGLLDGCGHNYFTQDAKQLLCQQFRAVLQA